MRPRTLKTKRRWEIARLKEKKRQAKEREKLVLLRVRLLFVTTFAHVKRNGEYTTIYNAAKLYLKSKNPHIEHWPPMTTDVTGGGLEYIDVEFFKTNDPDLDSLFKLQLCID